eukprot:m.81179 g.81179  ORF g.81179 m.81179 type:complete len:88 (+) comp20966_c0_seq2:433-696(+)
MLKDYDLEGDEALPYIEKKNPHYDHWGKMKLFLRCQVEKRAYERFGGEDGLNDAFLKREEVRAQKKREKHARKMKKASLCNLFVNLL